MREYRTLLVEKRDGITIITLNRPEKLNAVNFEMISELLELFHEIEVDEEVKVVIVTGAGRAFCAGADISELTEDVAGVRKQVGIVKQIYEFEKPVIGAINGISAGNGSQWMLAFDLNVASEEARISWPATRLGILCPYGIIRLPAEVGRFRAKEVLMTNKYLSAEEAYQWGLVTKVVPREQLMDSAMELANEIKKMPPLSIKAIKEAVNSGMEGYEYARQVIANLQRTEDAKEGIRAFIEKREPHFQGR